MKPYTLIGVDSNAFSIMGYTTRAMREAHLSKECIDSYQKNAASGDYNHLIAISQNAIELCNTELGLDEEDSTDDFEDDTEDDTEEEDY